MQDFKFKKKFGQNFLKNKQIIEKIVTSINPTNEDLIIEIGPGAGAITKELKRYNSKLIAFEIDNDTYEFLKPLEDERTKIVYTDFLEIDLKEYLKNENYKKLYIIGNLPYYITTPIIEKIMESNIDHESVTIMIQKEVADRFTAIPKTKEYGYMTVLLNYWYDIKKITKVSNNDFVPKPKVDSAVVQLKFNKKSNIEVDKFKKLIKECFQFKRKTLNNNIKSYDKTIIEKILNNYGYNLQNRAEEIELDAYIEIAKSI